MDAIDNTQTTGVGVPIYLLNNTRLVDDYVDLWDGSVDIPIDITETADNRGFAFVWTGSTTGGQRDPDYAVGSSTWFTKVGRTVDTDSYWCRVGTSRQDNNYSIYALSSLLTVQDAIPEPGSLMLAAMGVSVVLVGHVVRRRRKRD